MEGSETVAPKKNRGSTKMHQCSVVIACSLTITLTQLYWRVCSAMERKSAECSLRAWDSDKKVVACMRNLDDVHERDNVNVLLRKKLKKNRTSLFSGTTLWA